MTFPENPYGPDDLHSECTCGNCEGFPLDEFPDELDIAWEDMPTSMRISAPDMTVNIEQDDGAYIAMVEGVPAIFGYGDSPEEAFNDLMRELEQVVWN